MQAKVMICRFPGQHSEHPDSSNWAWRTYEKAKADPRISEVRMWHKADTPITMTRNLAIVDAISLGMDYVCFVDSDMQPDCEPDGKPFWDTSFDFAWQRRHAPLVIGAPYVGPPPHNNIYVFEFEDYNNYDDQMFHLPQYTRAHAARMTGICRCGALPTGVILYSMSCFKRRASDPGPGMPPVKDKGWYYYEWTDETCSKKASTEDVTNTRDIGILLSQSGIPDAGVYCNWDAWAAHIKPQKFTKPRQFGAQDVGDVLRQAWEAGVQEPVTEVNLNFPKVEAGVA